MTSNLLNIVYQESQPIDEEKLKFICTKHDIWGHFKISKAEYASFSNDEKMQMLKRFYTNLEPVYHCQGKNIFCCLDCVFLDDGKCQYCLNCSVNVLHCDCSSDDEKLILPTVGNK